MQPASTSPALNGQIAGFEQDKILTLDETGINK
jgi:hypothetical protein